MEQKFKGISLVIIASILWGASGTLAQFLFQQSGFTPDWLVGVRMLLSGVLLVGYALLKNKTQALQIWQQKTSILQLLLFSVWGMIALQYTYFQAIKAGNAATATILQFLAPVIITGFLALRCKKLPHGFEGLAISLALTGTFLLVTQGNWNRLSISVPALVWGVLSAFALAFYTLYPRRILASHGAISVVGWAMLIGGLCLNILHPFWRFAGELSAVNLLAIAFIVVCGTLLAFLFYLQSLNFIAPAKASLLTSIEPLSASVLAILFLNVTFGVIEWTGALLIISTVFVLSFAKSA